MLGTRSRLALMVATVALVATACWAPSFTPNTYAVTVTSNIVYGRGEINGGGTFTDLKLDLYSPQGTGQTQLPVVVVVHGGGFSGGSKTQSNVVAWSRAFASRGFLVASIDYRLSGTRPIPSARVRPLYDAVLAGNETAQEVAAVAAIDDTLRAIDYLVARSDTSNGPVALVGGSAGAITVDYVAYVLDDFGIARPPVGAVVSNWGGLAGRDPVALIDNPVPTTSNPYTEPPIFLAHATGDPTVAYSQSTAIAARASAVGLDHVLYTKNANVHGFDLAAEVFEPGTSVLEAQVDFVTCQMYPHVANAPECT
jgi:acetyl esterase/lipase